MRRVLPILFNTEMVQAILDGRKTCTRRLVKPQPDEKHTYPLSFVTDSTEKKEMGCFGFGIGEYGGSIQYAKAPYQPGDILYVRETWHKYTKRIGKGESCRLAEFYGYKASVANSEDAEEPWKPSIHMPKEAARIWLNVTNVRVERLQEMKPVDVIKEGAYPDCWDCLNTYGESGSQCCYRTEEQCSQCDEVMMEWEKLWNSTIKKSDLDRYGWDANPWVWVIEFERCEKPEGV
jgi:hypothetical protein